MNEITLTLTLDQARRLMCTLHRDDIRLAVESAMIDAGHSPVFTGINVGYEIRHSSPIPSSVCEREYEPHRRNRMGEVEPPKPRGAKHKRPKVDVGEAIVDGVNGPMVVPDFFGPGGKPVGVEPRRREVEVT